MTDPDLLPASPEPDAVAGLRPAWDGLTSPTRGFPVAPPTFPQVWRYRTESVGRVVGARRRGELEEVRRGVFLLDDGGPAPTSLPGPDASAELVAIAGVEKRLSTWYAFSHRTAAVVLGLWAGPWDGRVEVTQESVPSGKVADPRGLVRHRGSLPPADLRQMNGFAVTSVERTAVDCARALSLAAALPVVDSALLIGASAARMEDLLIAAGGKRGVRGAREVLRLATGRIGSPAESVVRARVVADGLPEPETLIRVRTAGGTYEVDMGWSDLRVGIEVHGRGKYRDGADPLAEAQRRELLHVAGWLIIDVRTGQRPAEYLARVRTALRQAARERRIGLADPVSAR